VRGRRCAVEDQRAHEITVLALLDQVDRRRGAFFPPTQFAQIHRLAEPAGCLTDSQDRFAFAFEGERG
jgi:hypothetical protein